MKMGHIFVICVRGIIRMTLVHIRITKEAKDMLDSLKVHPREPYHEVVDRVLKFYLEYKEKD